MQNQDQFKLLSKMYNLGMELLGGVDEFACVVFPGRTTFTFNRALYSSELKCIIEYGGIKGSRTNVELAVNDGKNTVLSYNNTLKKSTLREFSDMYRHSILKKHRNSVNDNNSFPFEIPYTEENDLPF